MPPNKSAASNHGFDETALSGLDIAARDGGEVERQAPGQVSLWWQAVARRQTPRCDVGRDRIGDGEIFRALATLKDWRPGLHAVNAGPRRPELTADCWTSGAAACGAGKLQKLASIAGFDRIAGRLTGNLAAFTGF